MYRINDIVIYGTEGICSIVDIADKKFGSTVEKYYVLKPMYNNSSTIMIPVNNELLVDRMRHILSSKEAEALILDMPTEQGIEWIDDEKQRKTIYRQIICRGDRRELVKLIKTLYNRQKQQKAIGKKLHACDERFFRDAEKMLHEEIAAALNIEKESVVEFIISKIGREA